MVFDLDGFKRYNDTFGHPAGDALLTRLGAKLAAVPGPDGCAYRLGGDEFCLIVPVAEGEAEGIIDRACDALSEHGEGFEVGTSFGAVLLPDEAEATPIRPCGSRTSASTRRSTPAGSTTDVMMDALLEALSLRQPDLPGASRQRRLARGRGRNRATSWGPTSSTRCARRGAPRHRQGRDPGRDPA